jgi:starch phosphorylase
VVAGAQSLVELGSRLHSIFRDLDPVRFRQLNHNPISMLAEIPLDGIERRAQQLVLHSRH